MNLKESLRSMESGECRWIGREDIHVYCKAPMGRLPLYAVVCPDAGRHECDDWMIESEAAALIEDILESGDPIRDGWIGSDGRP